jgi:hypothetical protein
MENQIFIINQKKFILMKHLDNNNPAKLYIVIYCVNDDYFAKAVYTGENYKHIYTSNLILDIVGDNFIVKIIHKLFKDINTKIDDLNFVKYESLIFFFI